MDVNRQAPVIAKTEMQITADRQTVWETLVDFETWPEWRRDVRSMSLRGTVAPGSTFEWRAGPGTIKSRLEEVDAPSKIAWTGSTLGTKAVDVFRLEAHDGGTLVTEEESWDGLLAWLLRSRMRRTLRAALDRGMEELKVEAEKRARQSAAA